MKVAKQVIIVNYDIESARSSIRRAPGQLHRESLIDIHDAECESR